ncbi:MAG: hypothetical protein NWE98_01650 [Candidatus Bathyarchaeota archaeon]|nr:hypothetical protein [Candidatus Bathyarchaeota archaeon]
MIKHKRCLLLLAVLALFAISVSTLALKPATAQTTIPAATNTPEQVQVTVGAWLVNVEKVDLAANSYRLDFYLWFKWDPSKISLDEVKDFEFVNGAPTKTLLQADASHGYLEYRVRGDFLTSFDFSRYPFESHDLIVQVEHNTYGISKLVYTPDPESTIEEAANIAGWNLQDFKTGLTQHTYGGDTFSRFVFSITLARPMLSAFIKSVLPISVITAISLLALFIAPQNFTMRITLAVTTLLAATTFHLSLLSGIPTTGYLTLADKIMISVYALFLYNLASSVFIMHQVDKKMPEVAASTRRKALKFLPVMVILMILLVLLL